MSTRDTLLPGSTAVESSAEYEAQIKSATGARIARNTAWNILGQAVPLLGAVLLIPAIVRGLGTDRFGVLTIGWIVVGYFSFFDLGMGRALTNLVAQKLGAQVEESLPATIWTASLIMAGLGVLAAIAFELAAPLVIRRFMNLAPGLQPEATRAFYILGLSVPFVVSTAGFRGVLEALHEFKLINLIRIPLGAITFFVPWVMLQISGGLVGIFAALTIARILFWALYVVLVMWRMPPLRRCFRFETSALPQLLAFGSWMTVSNIVSPMMCYLDRFLVSALLGATAVAYYATPYEVANKLMVLPMAFVSVLFPAFSTTLVLNRRRGEDVFNRALQYAAFTIFPPVLIMTLFAHEGIGLWLGPAFAKQSAPVLQWFSVGVFINSLGLIPFALIQGDGRSDITGKLHLAELPIYLTTVWVLTREFGIIGTAAASVIRVSLDLGALLWFGSKITGYHIFTRRRLLPLIGMAIALCTAPLFSTVFTKLCFLSFVIGLLLYTAWHFLLREVDQNILRTLFLRKPAATYQ